MEWFRSIVDLLIGISWPAAVTAIAIVYKSEIPALLRRVRKAGPAGFEFDPAEQQRRTSIENLASLETGEIKPIPSVPRSRTIVGMERAVFKYLEGVPDSEHLPRLARAFAEGQLSLMFERIYRVIFGSQINGLKHLYARQSVTINDARQFFEDVKYKWPGAYEDYGFEGWLGFMKTNRLVHHHDDVVEITDIGRDFLSYLTAQGLPENKLF